jgi:quinol monooxygenase YgiN
MLIVAGTITFDPSHQDRMVEAAGVVAAATREESGCISYEFFTDLTTPGRLHLFEEWDHEDSLVAHFETPHLKAFYEVMQSSGLLERNINRYYVSSWGANHPGKGLL